MSVSHWGILPGVVWTTTADWSRWFEALSWESYLEFCEKHPSCGLPRAHKVSWVGVFG